MSTWPTEEFDVLPGFDSDKGPDYHHDACGRAIYVKRQKQDRYGSGM